MSETNFAAIHHNLVPFNGDRSQAIRALALEQSSRGEYAEAIATISQLIENRPQRAIDYNNRGLIHYQNQQYAAALTDYNQAIALDERLDSAYNNRANCYAAQGNLAAAISDYQTALDFNPGNIRAWINQGITYRQMGLYDLALENFDFALLFSARLQGRIYGERGRTYHLRGDWNCAIADYQNAIAHLPATLSSRRYQKRIEAWIDQLLKPLSA
ncbi:MAG: tetratricopeptide repeat protein [Jaaginema sp. PMC 1079.18]|nr:tetratricopeptide repeat protein [Jaaginema sp. PMC 1080.18]MEC4851716.1 tetratricopeptide repeat protein [Jaaginema sp. PMC 1079.18]MEC4868455.1 tetratricopeptide repeat protein [Jaaginema sp. PMC 1078.18]